MLCSGLLISSFIPLSYCKPSSAETFMLQQCRGNGASVLRIVPYAAIHFTAYETYRKAIVGLVTRAGSSQQVSPVVDLLAGSAAGASAVLFTYPLDLVRTRLAYQSESGKGDSSKLAPEATKVSQAALSDRGKSSLGASTSATPHRIHSILPHSPPSTIRGVISSTLRQEGFFGLYRGIGPTLAGILPYAGLKFYVYQSLKQYYWRRKHVDHDGFKASPVQKLPVPVMLTFGAGAGLVAQTLTYPLDVVRRRMQVQDVKLPPQQIVLQAEKQPFLQSTWHGLVTIGRQHGRKALFAGLSINYMKVVPSTAIGFTLYDTMKSYLDLPNNL